MFEFQCANHKTRVVLFMYKNLWRIQYQKMLQAVNLLSMILPCQFYKTKEPTCFAKDAWHELMPLSHLIVHLEVSPEGNKNLNKYSLLAGVPTTNYHSITPPIRPKSIKPTCSIHSHHNYQWVIICWLVGSKNCTLSHRKIYCQGTNVQVLQNDKRVKTCCLHNPKKIHKMLLLPPKKSVLNGYTNSPAPEYNLIKEWTMSSYLSASPNYRHAYRIWWMHARHCPMLL